MVESSICIASPSLALVKYWGKREGGANIPATSSLAVTLDGLDTETVCEITDAETDVVAIDGSVQPRDRFEPFFDHLRTFFCRTLEFSETLYHTQDPASLHFSVRSTNSFPTAAGIASSSSGFAALAGACTAAVGLVPPLDELSALARVGSGSAARSVYGGFVTLRAGALHAVQAHPEDYWPELRIIVVILDRSTKSRSSRDAMESARQTSPFYPSWVESAEEQFSRGIEALENRDIELLGASMRKSYLRMFSTMFSSDPPTIYWAPDSLRVIHICDELRSAGVAAWETMDAGPQVKVVTTRQDQDRVRSAIESAVPGATFVTARPGPGLRYPDREPDASHNSETGAM